MGLFVTVGVYCDQCKSGFYQLDSGNPAGCDPCDCNPVLSLGTLCDRATGQCECKLRVGGRQCKFCEAGWYISENTCSQCSCNTNGTQPGTSCNSTSGQCVCKAAVLGLHCDTCKDGYYGSVFAVLLTLVTPTTEIIMFSVVAH